MYQVPLSICGYLILGQQLCREAFAWRQLDHPNILKLHGVAHLPFADGVEMPCLVTTFIEYSHLKRYLTPYGAEGKTADDLHAQRSSLVRLETSSTHTHLD